MKTSLLKKKGDRYWIYWSEEPLPKPENYKFAEKWFVAGKQDEWFLSCEQNGDFAEVAESDINNLTWAVFVDHSDIPTKSQFDVAISEGIIIPNDCYEVRGGYLVTLKNNRGTVREEWADLAYFKEPKRENLKQRNRDIDLLESYSQFLEENGYLDADWRTEEPFTIDEFLKKQSKT